MKIIDPGHVYELHWFDGKPPLEHPNSDWDLLNDTLVFMKRVGDKYPGNKFPHAGTNLQEVMRALIDRVKYLDNQIHNRNNLAVIDKLRECIWLLEDRAASRHKREFDYWPDNIELEPTCKFCGHIGCNETCR